MRKAPRGPISEAEAAALFGAFALAPALVLAVSGGPDSTALLWLAARWRDRLTRPPRLIAVTVDHGLRQESAREALVVKRLARRLKVEHHTLPWTGRKPKTAIQEAARHARYRLLAELARRKGASHVMTAHTLDDQAETVLFRLARGSGVGGLAAMRRIDVVPVPEAGGVRLVRPLLAVAKARLIGTLDSAGVAYAVDPSNTDPRFARPRLRALLPALAAEGLTAERLARLAARAERVEATLARVLDAARRALAPAPWRAKGPVAADRARFFDLPQEIGLRLMGQMVDFVGNEGPAELGKLEALYAQLAAAEWGSRGASAKPVRRTLAGAMITLSDAKLSVERAPPRRKTKKARSAKTPFTKAR